MAFAPAAPDLHLRGPGEYLGERQSGAPLLRFADLEKDEPMIAEARAHVERWLGSRQEFARV